MRTAPTSPEPVTQEVPGLTPDLAVDHCYHWPSFRALGVVCKTHLAPNTAMRGFGAPQAFMTIEHFLEHLASALEVPCDKLRHANLYTGGDESAAAA